MRRHDLSYPPSSMTVYRDGLGRVLSFQSGYMPVWTITRDGLGRVESLTDGRFLRELVRDGNGAVSAVVVTQL